MDGDAGANELRGDVRLQIREGENQIGLERQYFRDIRRDECRYARPLTPDLWRAHRVAGDAHDAILLAKQI